MVCSGGGQAGRQGRSIGYLEVVVLNEHHLRGSDGPTQHHGVKNPGQIRV